ncbi:MAG: YfcE family phosphodiesterase [Thermoproteota archaeon]|nr:MAG: YfcE family phosphodiesterase [Candidatus Korarchaeota archaeon]RLG56270.1 MAG: YfcE family phosphodiesterase [Candidatus Korarchaeota archaeon]
MIGIMSDSHDRLEKISKAVRVLNHRGVAAVLHAGDIVSPFTVRAFRELRCKVHFVWGNNDGDKLTLIRLFGDMATFHGWVMHGTVGGLSIYMAHHIPDELAEKLARAGFNLIISGHTHSLSIRRLADRSMLINPGEVCGYLTGRSTVVVLDSLTMQAEVVEL